MDAVLNYDATAKGKVYLLILLAKSEVLNIHPFYEYCTLSIRRNYVVHSSARDCLYYFKCTI